jgi:hypothetical protein
MTLLTFDHMLRKVFLKLWSAEVFEESIAKLYQTLNE